MFIFRFGFLAIIFTSAVFSAEQEGGDSEDWGYYFRLREKAFQSDRSKTWLLSFARSGNTWVRYCIEVLTKRPTFDKKRPWLETAFPLALNCGHEIDYSKEPVIKVHSVDEVSCCNEYDKLIVLVRNYQEVFLRHYSLLPTEEHFTTNSLICRPASYFTILDFYERWPADKRLLLYYEDIVTDLPSALATLVAFLDGPLDAIPDFMEQSVMHTSISKELYKQHGGTKSDGVDLTFHSKSVSREELQAFNDLVKMRYPTLHFAYLQRYDFF